MSTTVFLSQFLPCYIGPPPPPPPPPRIPSICISHAVLTAPLECFTCPNQRSLLSLKMRLRSSSSSFASSLLDQTVTTSSGLILQICLIIALQALQVRLGQWQSFTGMEHGATRARAVYMAMGLVREMVGSDSYFTASTSRKHVTQVAEGSYHLQL